METLELSLIILLILCVLISMIISRPMRKHLLADTGIKRIDLFQMPFYLKDYNKMIADCDDPAKKSRYRSFFIVFLLSNLVFILAAIALFMLPGITQG